MIEKGFEKPEVWAVVPAGGRGSRFSGSEDKLLIELAGVPVLVRTLQALLSAPSIAGVVLAVSVEKQAGYQTVLGQHFSPDAMGKIVFASGGQTRRESVLNGLLAVPETAEIVAIHDAARPLIGIEIIEHAVTAVTEGKAGAVVAVPVVDTLKQADPAGKNVQKTIDRALLWRAQTPQVFLREMILKAHRMVPLETPVTDDAQLMELAGLGPVVLVPGDECNIKITTPADVWLAEALLCGVSEGHMR